MLGGRVYRSHIGGDTKRGGPERPFGLSERGVGRAAPRRIMYEGPGPGENNSHRTLVSASFIPMLTGAAMVPQAKGHYHG